MFPKYNPSLQTKAVIAHRGGAGLWPENTIFALQQVKLLGADWSEIDIQCSKDGVFVVIHDDTVDRTTNGYGRVTDLTLAQLKSLDAGFWWTNDGGKTYPFRGQNITIPTLEEVFQTFPQQPVSLEIKFNHAKLAVAFYQLLQRYQMTEHVLVSSFHASIVHKLRHLYPQLATAATRLEAILFFNLNRVGLINLCSSEMVAFELPDKFWGRRAVTEHVVSVAHQHQKRVDVWTVNNVADMQEFLACQVDGILTDFPDKLLDLLGRL